MLSGTVEAGIVDPGRLVVRVTILEVGTMLAELERPDGDVGIDPEVTGPVGLVDGRHKDKDDAVG